MKRVHKLHCPHEFLYLFARFSQGRSAGTFAQGGSQQPFRTQLGLFRNLDGAFTKSLESGSVVQLGEELMLRAQVKSGDGEITYKINIQKTKKKNVFMRRLES